MDEPRSASRPATPRAGDVLGSDLTARLARWLHEARTADAAAARARERWLRVQADESATFAGVLVDLAERATAVVVHGRGGRRHRGTITAVAHDFCAVRTAGGRDVFLTFAGIASVRPDAATRPPAGDRAITADVRMVDALAFLAADRPRVLIVTIADADGIAGELRAVGRDVVTLQLDGDSRAAAYVHVPSIAELSLV